MNFKNSKKYSAVIIIVFVAAVSVFFFYNRSASPQTQPSKENDEIHKTILPGDDEKIFASINGEHHESVTVYPNISHDSVKELLSDIEMPQSYCWYFKSSLHSSRKSLSEVGILKFDGDSYKIEIYDENRLKKTVIEESGVISVSIPGASQVAAEFNSGSTTAFSEAGVPDVAEFLDSDGENYDYSLVESEYGTLLFAEFLSTKGNYVQTEQYYISLDYGIVVRADCYENESLVYSLETTALYELENM